MLNTKNTKYKEKLFAQDNKAFENWAPLLKDMVSQHAWLASVPLDELNKIQKATSSLRVAAYWYHFSVFAADFLCVSLPLLQSHANRSYVAQTVDEELGSGVPEQVHSILLLEALSLTGMDINVILAYPTIELDNVLQPFKQRLLQSQNDYEIAGFFLGFELLAEHNISHVFECLQPYGCSKEELLQTAYFQEHFKVEPEHIKRAITMGMNSCSSEHQIKSMLDTFHHGIAFWNSFWKTVHQDVIKSHTPQLSANEKTLHESLLAQV